MIKKIAEDILNSSELLDEIDKLLLLNIDDKWVGEGTDFLKSLDKLEIQTDDSTIKLDVDMIKNKVKNSMQIIQDVYENLFSLQQRIINEENLSKGE